MLAIRSLLSSKPDKIAGSKINTNRIIAQGQQVFDHKPIHIVSVLMVPLGHVNTLGPGQKYSH